MEISGKIIMKKFLALLLTLALMAGVIPFAAAEASNLEPVELTIMFHGSNVTDDTAVLAKVNEYLKDKINATLKVIWGTWGDFDETSTMPDSVMLRTVFRLPGCVGGGGNASHRQLFCRFGCFQRYLYALAVPMGAANRQHGGRCFRAIGRGLENRGIAGFCRR